VPGAASTSLWLPLPLLLSLLLLLLPYDFSFLSPLANKPVQILNFFALHTYELMPSTCSVLCS
jgi:hypothetical protein